MILKKFNDDFDAEFVHLMLEIQNLIINFCKSDKLKINSWAKILCAPTVNIEFKKNRNLYAIQLLDNVLNGKLEEPFNKFAKDKELKKLDPILVKSQLTTKFVNEIKKFESDDNFLNYESPELNQYTPYKNENQKLNSNMRIKQNTQNNFYKNNLKRKNNNNKVLYADYDNQFLLVPPNHKRSKSSYKISKNNGNNNILYNNYYYNNEKDLTPSDILLIKNFGNLPYHNKANLMNLTNNYRYNRFEKYKLRNIIDRLNDQRLENNEIIMNQKNEIDKLKKKISQMQLKIKNIYDSQK